jgi:hypothetical protein
VREDPKMTTEEDPIEMKKTMEKEDPKKTTEDEDPNKATETTKTKVEEDLAHSTKPSFDSSPSPSAPSSDPHPFFHFMARMPWPFLIVVPVVFAFLIGFGWQTDEKVETSIVALWTAQEGDYAKDQRYARKMGSAEIAQSSFAAMAVSRDGKNIFTESRLEEIRSRMEATEGATVSASYIP